ncbi:MAG: LacI family DNA-binding transcriptional regulator [Anaerolineae bacterium]|nr:LacI family DNA-binding transcriptional regulator [Anaerolineae bacterium]
MATIQDVARRAGVAPITVSRVINHSGYVSEEKRQRVEAAVLALNYIPNALGPSLRSKRTQTLAVVLSDITNPFWTTVARGIEDTANQNGYHVIIGNTDESPEKQNDYLTFLMKKQVDGFLVVPASFSPLAQLTNRQIPFVVLDRRLPGEKVDSVRCDSVGGAYQLTQHLLALGHRRIGVITGREDHSTALDRVVGARQAVSEAGLGEGSLTVYWGEFTQACGYDYAAQLLRITPRPTAIFAANNFIAIGVMRWLRERGLRVPEDISVVAFDDLPPAITIDSFFTVAAQPAYEMGRQATLLLLAHLAGDGATEPQEIVLPVEMIVRKSSGIPPQNS